MARILYILWYGTYFLKGERATYFLRSPASAATSKGACFLCPARCFPCARLGRSLARWEVARDGLRAAAPLCSSPFGRLAPLAPRPLACASMCCTPCARDCGAGGSSTAHTEFPLCRPHVLYHGRCGHPSAAPNALSPQGRMLTGSYAGPHLFGRHPQSSCSTCSTR